MKCYVSPYEGKEDFLFFSYCHDDEATVYPVIERLAVEGFRVWYDDGIHPGDDWPEVIAEHLSRARVCVVSVSAASIESHNCKNEMNFAIGKNKPTLSILMEEFQMPLGIQLQLSSSNYIRKFDQSEESFYDCLLASPVLSNCRDGEHHTTEENINLWREHVQEYRGGTCSNKASSGFVIDPTWFDERNKIKHEIERLNKEREEAERLLKEQKALLEQREKEERRKKEEAEKNRKAEEKRLLQEAEQRRQEEEACRKKEEAEKNRKAEEKRLLQEEEKRRQEEEARRKKEEAVRKAEIENGAASEEQSDGEMTVYQPADQEIAIEGPTVIGGTFVPAILFRVKTGELFVIKKDTNILGRSEKADLVISGNKGISREHAQILKEGGRLYLCQLAEKNITEVDGKKAEWEQTVPLAECSELMLGTGENTEQFFLVYGKACERVLDEQKLCMLRSKDTGEVKLLVDQSFPLNRYHKWKQNVLGDPQISRENHAVIYRNYGRLFLRDTGSKKGTYHNGKRLEVNESVELHHGDVISIVNTKFDYFELAKMGD